MMLRKEEMPSGSSRELWQKALGEGIKYGHPVYDMYYAVLARRNNAVLLTTDKQLVTLGRKMKIDICIYLSAFSVCGRVTRYLAA